MARRRKSMKKPLSVGDILNAGGIFGRRGANLLPMYRLQSHWEEIVGADLAQRTFPLRVQGKALVITAENPAWAQHLSLMKETILAVIEERAGRRFSDLRFVSEPIPKR